MNAPTVMNRKNMIYLLFVVFGGFLIFGISENAKGPAIPGIQSDFSLSESQLGLLLALNSFGYLLACTFTAALSRRIGLKATGILAFGFMAFSGVLMYYASSYNSLSGAFFLLYIANGMLEIGLGMMAARIFTKNTGTMMNISHFFYGLGSTVAPLMAANMMGWQLFGGGELGWRGMFLIMLSISLLPIIPSLLGRFPGGQQEDANSVSVRGLARDPIAWTIVAILSFGVVSELAVGSWLVYYLTNVYEWSTDRASGMLSIFFLFFMLARLLLGPIIDKIGYTLSVTILAAFSGLCSLAAIAAGEPGAILFAIAGIGIAPIYPTVMAIIAKRYAGSTDAAITFVVTMMGIGSVLGNLLIGYVIDWVRAWTDSGGGTLGRTAGLQAGYGLIALLALLCSVTSLALYIVLRRRRETV